MRNEIRPGVVCRHHSGRVYDVMFIANDVPDPRPEFPVTVVYMGADGKVWARPLATFRKKFEVVYDGSQTV